ncbi:uncharacterized protein LOC110440917, partial [Mizuhopecten yessoensis]|uniref:uncharacterized protein LOC110440917 n=1 Tax=Mizuhopecten yessoensis TaxID=6573 RepID=UPI000B45A3B2
MFIKKSNPKVSYIPDESKPAYIICNFEMNQELANTVSNVMESKKDLSMSSSFDKTPQTKTFMYSCCFVYKNPSTGKQLLFKVVCVYDSPMTVENMRLYIQRFPLEGSVIKLADSYDEWKSDSRTNPELAKQFLNLDKQIAADEGIEKAAADEGIGKAAAGKSIEKAINAFSSLLNGLEEQARKNDIGEEILRQLDGVVVVTFPVRGHGPLQRNQNPEMGKVDGGYGKYRSASDGAVIIHALLDSPDVDHQEADKTFNELISPNMFVFKKKEKQGNSSTSKSNKEQDQEYEIVVEKQGHAVPLMKIPEGILEARHFSLLLAHKKYQTICLEEPGRGMHPPMVQRIRDLLLRKQKGKTLIVISHKPSMVNFWAFDRMFVSRTIFHAEKPYHSVRRVRSAMLR